MCNIKYYEDKDISIWSYLYKYKIQNAFWKFRFKQKYIKWIGNKYAYVHRFDTL